MAASTNGWPGSHSLDQLQDLLFGHFHYVLRADEDDVVADVHTGQVGRHARLDSLDPAQRSIRSVNTARRK